MIIGPIFVQYGKAEVIAVTISRKLSNFRNNSLFCICYLYSFTDLFTAELGKSLLHTHSTPDSLTGLSVSLSDGRDKFKDLLGIFSGQHNNTVLVSDNVVPWVNSGTLDG